MSEQSGISMAPSGRCFEYGGEPVLLLGGTVEDNLFQIPDLEEHLDLLRSVGGNYVRCTMSSRDEGNVWPFEKAGELYDLDRWNDEYWRRFSTFLDLTRAREIIVQIEVWATFDYYRNFWERNPFNPRNNSNYSAEESGLAEAVDSHPVETQSDFFRSVPGAKDLALALKYQTAFVDKMLSVSLPHDHVLYCMDNETSVGAEWGEHWSAHIKRRAEEAGKRVLTTEMWDPWDLEHEMHRATLDHPETYDFCDVSQNNHNKGQVHYDKGLRARARASDPPRPMTNVKIYGADTGGFGKTLDGVERFWRNIFCGHASARFHRPNSGLGLTGLARRMIRSMRDVTDAIDVFSCEPRPELLSDRAENAAYCLASPGKEYAVYFTDGGSVTLDASGAGKVELRWYEIDESRFRGEAETVPGGRVKLVAPGPGRWAAVLKAVSPQ